MDWFRENQRTLPWREQATPYAVWVSEVMLQQTRVEVVKDYFNRFMARFPTIADLARAEEEEVLRHFQGLGYYSRARRLHAGAKYVLREHRGVLPRSTTDLLKVPGVGPYSAGAISSIAFGEAAPLVDGNVIRVLSRLFVLGGNPQKEPLKSDLWRLATELVHRSAPGDFNQGLMELGALVYTPKNPSCFACPLRTVCEAEKSGQVLRFPELPQRTPKEELSMVAALVRFRGRYVIEKRGVDVRWWQGLYAFPTVQVETRNRHRTSALQTLARKLAHKFGSLSGDAELVPLASHKHTVTRYNITLHPFVVRLGARSTSQEEFRFLPLSKISELGLPAPHRRVLDQALRWERES